MKYRVSVFVMIVAVLAVSIVSFAPAVGEKKKKTEVEGTWKLTKGGKGAPMGITFSDNNFVLTFAADRVLKGTFKLNTKENPSWMDIRILSDSEEMYKGKTALCIYNFDGDVFLWCASIPGRKRRPQQFAETMGDARLLFGRYKKDKK